MLLPKTNFGKKLMQGSCTKSRKRIRLLVRSAMHKPQIGVLVVGWVAASESTLLYIVFFIFLLQFLPIIFQDYAIGHFSLGSLWMIDE